MSNDAGINKTIEDLYADMYPKLFIYAKNSLGDFHLAEEAVQDTFRIACAKSAQLIESQNRPGWLTNTLHKNVCRLQLTSFSRSLQTTSSFSLLPFAQLIVPDCSRRFRTGILRA